MKRSLLFMLALTLIGSSALAQVLPSYGPWGGPSVPPSNPPTVSNPPTAGATSGAPADVTAVYGTSTGVRSINDPYGTAAAASRFGTSPGPVSPQAPSGASSATQYNPYPYGVRPR